MTQFSRDYDFSLFENHTDKQLSKLYNVTKQSISLLRLRYVSHTNSLNIAFKQNTDRINSLILEYIKTNPKNICILKFRKLYNISANSVREKHQTQIINKNRFLKIALENGIEINFSREKSKYDHGLHCFKKNCKCNIRKLANGIRHKLRKSTITKYKKLSFDIINALANKYVNLYLELVVMRRKGRVKVLENFYVDLFKEIDEISKNGYSDSIIVLNNVINPRVSKIDEKKHYSDPLDFNIPLMF